jgi:hypothetical protein
LVTRSIFINFQALKIFPLGNGIFFHRTRESLVGMEEKTTRDIENNNYFRKLGIPFYMQIIMQFPNVLEAIKNTKFSEMFLKILSTTFQILFLVKFLIFI